MNKKNTKISCRFLQRAVYYAPDELRHCCKRFYHKGEMKGDVPMFSLEENLDVFSIAIDKDMTINMGWGSTLISIPVQ